MKTSTFDCPIEIKDFDEKKGTFSGHLAVFGNLDSFRDIIQQGAFTRTLNELKSSGRKLPMLWQHDRHEPIGMFPKAVEDDKGLFVEGKLAINTQRGSEARELLAMGAISGMSIGFNTKSFVMDNENEIRTLTDIDLWEGSIVTFPANDAARIDVVKELRSIRDLERHLRESGLPRSVATSIALRGYDGLGLRESADDQEIVAGLNRLSDLLQT